MKINVGLVAEAAAKKPSAKAIQKAANTLKNAKKANAGDAKGKLQAAVDQAQAIYDDSASSGKILQAQIDKLTEQAKRLQTKLSTQNMKRREKTQKLAPKIHKLFAEFQKHGGNMKFSEDIAGLLSDGDDDEFEAYKNGTGNAFIDDGKGGNAAAIPPGAGSKSKKKSKK